MTPTHARATLEAIGTTCLVVVTDDACLDQAHDLLVSQLTQLDRAASRFREDAEIAHLQRMGGDGTDVSPLLATLLGQGLRAAHVSGGVVDPTVGTSLAGIGWDEDFPLVAAGPRRVRPVPAPGPGSVALDARRRRASVAPGTVIDLGSVAKAWAADRAARDIARATRCGVLVNLGGDIAVAGAAPETGWSIQLSDDHANPLPDDPWITFRRGGVATSSTVVRRWRDEEGSELHHIVDPRTGLPTAGPWRTVTVAAGSCVDANIAATAAIVHGSDAEAWLEVAGLPARLVGADARTVINGFPAEDVPA